MSTANNYKAYRYSVQLGHAQVILKSEVAASYISLRFQTKSSITYGGRFQAFLSYFPVTSYLFPCYFSNISDFPTISQLFLSYFSVISQTFPIFKLFLVPAFLSHFLLLDYFSSTSQ